LLAPGVVATASPAVSIAISAIIPALHFLQQNNNLKI